jgi:hypothetical protein
LKKSTLVSAAEKLAPAIEILKFGRGLRAQISRSDTQKRAFHWSLLRQYRQSTFSTESAKSDHQVLTNAGATQSTLCNCPLSLGKTRPLLLMAGQLPLVVALQF